VTNGEGRQEHDDQPEHSRHDETLAELAQGRDVTELVDSRVSIAGR
jgi:hypothetical protein